MAELTLPEASVLATTIADMVTTGRYCTLAAWILLLYDHIIHLDKEIELFWSKPWSMAKCLYFFVSRMALKLNYSNILSESIFISCISWDSFNEYDHFVSILHSLAHLPSFPQSKRHRWSLLRLVQV